jgi:hypothetical protein
LAHSVLLFGSQSENIKKIAEKIGIKLLFIPAGMADADQPLDCYVFGVMKASDRRMCHQFLSDDLTARMSKHGAVQFLARAWEQMSPHILEEVWSRYFTDDEI